MAMVFFILALALVLIGLSNKEKAGLCDARAESLVANVRSQVVNVVSAPIEDEIKVIPLERVLSTGSADFERYNLTVTWRELNPPRPEKSSALGTYKQELSIVAKTLSGACGSGYSLSVSDFNVHFIGNPPLNPTAAPHGMVVLTSEPSKKYGESGTGNANPSLYLIIVKCSTKVWPYSKHLFIDDCRETDPTKCASFSYTPIDKCCGWNPAHPEDPTDKTITPVCDQVSILGVPPGLMIEQR